MWGGGKMITVTRISIRKQYSLLREVIENSAFKIEKLKWAYGQRYLKGNNPSFQVYGLEDIEFFSSANLF